MNKLYFLLLILISVAAHATKYYCAPDGRDENPGTFNAPFFNLNKAWSRALPGDTIYMKGGYYLYTTMQKLTNKNGKSGAMMKVWAMPGERPIFDYSKMSFPTEGIGLEINFSPYTHVKGLRITNVAQGGSFNTGIAISSGNCIVENCEVDHIGGFGIAIYGDSDNNLILNCDSHHNSDPKSGYGNSDGFAITANTRATGTIFRGCRAWWNSDDGFDTFGSNIDVTYENCWSFWNGYLPGTFNQVGDGNGFKLGPNKDGVKTNILRRLHHCVAFENFSNGFDQNIQTGSHFPIELLNCTAYGNREVGFYFQNGAAAYILKNNLSFKNKTPAILTKESISERNSWNSNISVSETDFVSIVSTGVNGPRQADGSLPEVPFLQLKNGSKLIDAGIDVGLPFIGSNPDIGAFEFGYPANQSPTIQLLSPADSSVFVEGEDIIIKITATDPDGSVVQVEFYLDDGLISIDKLAPYEFTLKNVNAGDHTIIIKVIDNEGAITIKTIGIQVARITSPPSIDLTAPSGGVYSSRIPVAITAEVTQNEKNLDRVIFYLSGAPIIEFNSPPFETSLAGLTPGNYQITAAAFDSTGGMNADTVDIVVDSPPSFQSVSPPNETILNEGENLIVVARAIDVGGAVDRMIFYLNSDKIIEVNDSFHELNIEEVPVGDHTIRVVAIDNLGLTADTSVQIHINALPQIKIIKPGSDDVYLEGDSLLVLVEVSDPDGNLSRVNYFSGNSFLAGIDSEPYSFFFKNLQAGNIQLIAQALDLNQASAEDTIEFVVKKKQTPIVDAGPDLFITLPINEISILGSALTDHVIETILWTQVSGPVMAQLSEQNTLQLEVSGLVEGVYSFRLLVTDEFGTSAWDDMRFIVLREPVNQLPTVNTGPNRSITLPQNAILLKATASDPDGTIASYLWIQQQGPDEAALTGTESPELTASGLLEGSYTFRITVADNQGGTAYDVITIQVLPEPVNLPPAVDAGPNRTITLPENFISLEATAADADGTIESLLWAQQQGPADATLTGTDTQNLTASGLVEGSYTFRITATDNRGGRAYDDVIVMVFPEPVNQLPLVDAGSNRTLTLPNNSITLTGTATDPDGTVASYQWSQQSGPSTASMSSEKTVEVMISDLAEGSYTFRLTVSDNEGASAWDDVRITVLPEPVNLPPLANAGPDQSITLPIHQITLSGTASDPDGTIASYLWSQQSGHSTVTMSAQNTPRVMLNFQVEGSYTFRLTVTDNKGTSAWDDVRVTVLPAPVNQPPIVDAGNNITIVLPENSVAIKGSASDADGTIASYLWSQENGPLIASMSGQNTAEVFLANLLDGIYTFRLTATDNEGASAWDEVRVTVIPEPANMPPIANAGPDKSIILPVNSITFNGSGTDPDGTIVSLSWIQAAGPAGATLTGQNSETLTVSGLVEGVYTFRLIARDIRGGSTWDDVRVTVLPEPFNQPPTVDAGPDQSITLPISGIMLSGSASDPDGNVTSFLWSLQSGPSTVSMSGQSTAEVLLTDLVEGTFVFRLTVTDNKAASAWDDVRITVLPEPVNALPLVDAGPNKTLTLPDNTIRLTGSASDSDGTIASYLWSQQNGPSTASMSGQNIAEVQLSDLVEGTYTFRLTVTDNMAASAWDDVRVTVLPEPVNALPLVDAGPNKTLTLPDNSIRLAGSASDPDGSIEAYFWSQQSGPSTASMSGQNTAEVQLSNLVEGNYNFRLTVNDNKTASAWDEVRVTVLPEPVNLLPIVDAGPNITITLPDNSISLSGTASDPDGTIATSLWSQMSGPADAAMSGQNTANAVVADLIEGIYTFRLTVTDNKGASVWDEARITVLLEPVNLPPIANAGPDQSITLPVSTITLSGSGTDSDGNIESFQWSQRSGPATAAMSGQNTATVSLSDLIEGTFTFRFTVADNRGASAWADVRVNVLPEPVNMPPIANAGLNIIITLPDNSVSLAGTASDPDGTVESYKWSQQSGPATATISRQNTTSVSVSDLIEGTYTFRLTVTDNKGASAWDDLRVTVLPEPVNMQPIVTAGQNITLTLPVNSVSLAGTASDPDGTVESYKWSQQNGPSTAVLSGENASIAAVSGLIEGIYIFRLTVTDNTGASAWAEVGVTVLPEPANKPPIVTAGQNITLTLPDNSVRLAGTASDPDGTITTYHWTQESGPSTSSMSGQNSANAVVSDLIEGTYTFMLTVTDNKGATGFDEVNITVYAAPLVANTDDFVSLDVSKYFSPDGNGINDVWEIRNIDQFNLPQITIFNRAGQLVYESLQYDNNWSGTTNGGMPLPDGDYYYIFRSQNITKPLAGAVRIIRKQ